MPAAVAEDECYYFYELNVLCSSRLHAVVGDDWNRSRLKEESARGGM